MLTLGDRLQLLEKRQTWQSKMYSYTQTAVQPFFCGRMIIASWVSEELEAYPMQASQMDVVVLRVT